MATLFVQPSIAGIKRQLTYQEQPPLSSIESVNMFPFDPVTGRKGSSTRPPMVAFPTPGLNVNMLARVNGTAVQSPQSSMLAASNGALFWWNGASWTSAAMGSLAVDTGRTVFSTTFLTKVFVLNSGTPNGPLVFNYTDNSVATPIATAGTFPVGARIGATWQGGIWLGGSEAEPHVFAGSRTGDPLDWDFAQTDTGAAFTATGEAFGLIADPISAMFPLSGDVLIIGSENAVWALRGHPNRGGVLEQISRTVGILGQGAWTQTPDGRVYFLSHAGLSVLDAGGSTITSVSRDSIPDELFLDQYDFYNPQVNLEYDPRFNGIHITVRGVEEQAWWFDLDTNGFNQLTFGEYPFVLLYFSPVEAEGQSAVLYGSPGTRYGGISRYDTTGVELFDYRVLSGPIKISESLIQQSKVQTAQFLIDGGTTENSTSMNIKLWAGVTAEDVYNRFLVNDASAVSSTPVSTLIVNGGRTQPRITGTALMVELSGTTDSVVPERLVYEGVELELIEAGRSRRLPGRVGGQFDPSASFNSSQWTMYATATSPAAGEEDFVMYIDLSTMPTLWWNTIHPTGRDLRVATVGNTLLPYDLVHFDATAKTGFLVTRSAKTLNSSGSNAIRIWAGNPTVFAPGPSSTIGQFNAYGPDVLTFMPDAVSDTRTRNGITLNVDETALPENIGGGSSAAGAKSTPFPVVPFARVFYDIDNIQPVNDGITTMLAAKIIIQFPHQTSPIEVFTQLEDFGSLYGTSIQTQQFTSDRHAVLSGNLSGTTVTSANTFTFGGSIFDHMVTQVFSDGITLHKLFLNDIVNAVAPSAPILATPVSMIQLSLNAFPSTAVMDMALWRIDNTIRSSTYVTHTSNMLNQANFWGVWTPVTP